MLRGHNWPNMQVNLFFSHQNTVLKKKLLYIETTLIKPISKYLAKDATI
jgi:hypothetical protein